jgi:carbon-monoxide dehydrogenase large subunit
MSDRAPRFARVEDHALVTGAGRFSDDVPQERQAYAAFVRSPHAHARILSVDVAGAKTAAGVIAVLTGTDLEAAGVRSLSRHPPMPGRHGGKLVNPARPALASERALHAGEPLAMVVADTLFAATDAAELVRVEYEPIESVTHLRGAAETSAPQLWPEAAGNLALEWIVPSEEDKHAEVDRMLGSAAHVAEVELVNQRLIVASMEPRGATAWYDSMADHYTLRACSQGARPLADQLLPIMGLSEAQLRVYSEDVGGAFGMKTPAYPEYVALLVAARLTGRPVHWMSTRSEAFLSDAHARDTITRGWLALDDKGKFLALRIAHQAAMGAYLTGNGAHIQTNNFSRCFPGMYDIPQVAISVRCLFTNTVPTGPYRGAGRPEANYVLERLVEAAARQIGIDAVALRRKNLIAPTALPYRTNVGTTIDSGEFATILDKALALADQKGFAQRRRASQKHGRLRGFGVSCFLEHSGGPTNEGASITFTGADALAVGLAVHSTGQAHATVFRKLAADRLGIAPEHVTIRQADTALGVAGYASVASRSATVAGNAIVKAVEAVIEKGKRAAAQLFEAAESDIDYRDGGFEVAGTDRRISLFDLAAHAKADGGESLDANIVADTPQVFPNGCHMAEIEIDPETGVITIAQYTAVDDCGTVLDHTIVAGQVQGALAQGLGQALLEDAVYDRDSGQLIAGSFMDYAMPRAYHMPPLAEALHSVPAKTNALGVKGVGEAATTAAIAAVMNAVADAIPNGRGIAMDMPATPEKVWRALHH